MSVKDEIKKYITSLDEPGRTGIQELHRRILKLSPGSRLWFLTGEDEKGKIVSNPSIGYGSYTIKYADGTTREFYRVGISANTIGFSVYIMGIKDKTYLPRTYEKKIGKARVSGYCIRFRTMEDLAVDVLESAIRHGLERDED